jgi:uncharacterized protein YecE (DUF72 family)
MIHVSTSGYSYDDWVGAFYPSGTRKSEFLDYYRKHFDTTELNFTYYRMPTAGMLANIGNKVQPGFLFSVKAPGEITHDRQPDPRGVVRQFNEALKPLIDEDKFACVLAQFPTSFHADDPNRKYLKKLREGFGDTPVVIEFRNRGWVSEDTFDLLHDLQFGYCCVDQPQFESLMPPIAIATSAIAYARFHGRNYQKWWHHDQAFERYDYAYSAEELGEWVPRLKALDEQKGTALTLVYMNNHWQGQAPASANLLASLLDKAGARVSQKEQGAKNG